MREVRDGRCVTREEIGLQGLENKMRNYFCLLPIGRIDKELIKKLLATNISNKPLDIVAAPTILPKEQIPKNIKQLKMHDTILMPQMNKKDITNKITKQPIK